MQNAMHVPMFVCGSTFQHIDEISQLSIPDTPEPSTVHSSPGCAGAGSSGEQRVAFHELPPSFAHGMHFSPSGQSCAQISHSMLTPPPSGSWMNPIPLAVPVVSPLPLESPPSAAVLEGFDELPSSEPPLPPDSEPLLSAPFVALLVAPVSPESAESFFVPQPANASPARESPMRVLERI
jgi:hypothetical protein